MIGTLIDIILTLIILGVIWWGAQQLLALIPMGEPFATIIRVLLTIIMVLIVIWVLVIILEMAGIPVAFPLHR